MEIVNGWLSAILMFEFTVGAFLLFATRGVPLFYRMLGALFSLGCGVICAVFFYYLITDPAKAAMDMEPSLIIFVFLFANFFGFQLIRNLKDRPLEFGCFGTVLRMAGCIVVGWAVFAIVVFGIAILIYLGS